MNLTGQASHLQKAQAKYLASQKFLKSLMPVGTTWNQAVKLISDRTMLDDLAKILEAHG